MTIHYGQGHTFKVHADVLKPKSAWFAAMHEAGTDAILEDGPSPEVLSLFDHPRYATCRAHENDSRAAKNCGPAKLFKDLLQSCYFGRYPPREEVVDWDDVTSTRVHCRRHMFIYFLAKKYGIDFVLHDCASMFGVAADALRILDRPTLIKLVNAIYELPLLDEKDALRKEARRQAKLIADGTTGEISQELVRKELRSQIRQIMPVIGEELLASGYAPRAPAALAFDSHTCRRCTGPLESPTEQAIHTCRHCVEMPMRDFKVQIPLGFTAGLAIAIWQCQGCDQVWYSEALQTKRMSLHKCPTCVIPGKKMKAGTARLLEWQCRGCRTTWRQTGGLHEWSVLKGCICCL